MENIKISKTWAMPNKNTFSIKPVKDAINKYLKPNGICISSTWNSNGIGKCRKFKQIEILLVSHGGNHNDTIITVEKKML